MNLTGATPQFNQVHPMLKIKPINPRVKCMLRAIDFIPSKEVKVARVLEKKDNGDIQVLKAVIAFNTSNQLEINQKLLVASSNKSDKT